jgi:hypothetical protein
LHKTENYAKSFIALAKVLGSLADFKQMRKAANSTNQGILTGEGTVAVQLTSSLR